MFTSVIKLIPREINRRGISESMSSAQIVKVTELEINKLFPKFKDMIKAHKFKNGSVFVLAENSGISEMIYLESEKLIKAINTELGEELVKNIRLKLGDCVD